MYQMFSCVVQSCSPALVNHRGRRVAQVALGRPQPQVDLRPDDVPADVERLLARQVRPELADQRGWQ
jgi:hypothetical protein